MRQSDGFIGSGKKSLSFCLGSKHGTFFNCLEFCSEVVTPLPFEIKRPGSTNLEWITSLLSVSKLGISVSI